MSKRLNLIGQKFDKLTVIRESDEKIHGRVTWLCKCECNDEILKSEKDLKRLKNNDCGCQSFKETKECANCKVRKPKSDFFKRTDRKTGVQSKCKQCLHFYKKNRYWSNREEELRKATVSRTKPENVLQRKSYYQNNKERFKKLYHLNQKNEVKKAKKAKQSKKYRESEIGKAKSKEWYRNKIKTDPHFVIAKRLRNRVRVSLTNYAKGKLKTERTMELLGCELEFFVEYIESRFKDGMCWERISEIHLDHYIPCDAFDLTDIEHQRVCFCWLNIRPMWAVDNIKKSNKMPKGLINYRKLSSITTAPS